MEIAAIGIVAVLVVLMVLGMLAVIRQGWVKVPQGHALIVVGRRDQPFVSFTAAFVTPILSRHEIMDVGVKTVSFRREGREGIVSKDNLRATIELIAYIRVNKTVHDVLRVAQSIGSAQSSRPEVLRELFEAKLVEALKSVAKRFDFEEMLARREEFRDEIIMVVGQDLNGYGLEDLALPVIEQVPLEQMDPHNILDAQGIRKITDITADAAIRKAEREMEVKKRLAMLQLEVDEVVTEAARRRARFLAEVMEDGSKVDVEAMEAALDERVQQVVEAVRG